MQLHLDYSGRKKFIFTIVNRDPKTSVLLLQLLEFVEKHIEGSDVEADWLDAVVVALNFLKEETEGTKCRNKKIVLLSDLGCAANKSKLDVIAKGMQVSLLEKLETAVSSWHVNRCFPIPTKLIRRATGQWTVCGDKG